jgi:hypothetical protein
MNPPRVRLPGYFHWPAAARQANRLSPRQGPRRPVRIPVEQYTQQITGIPLTGGQGTAIVSAAGRAQISVGPSALGTVWYPAQVTISTTSGVNDGSTCNIYLGPAGVPVTLVATVFPGGTGTVAVAVPSMTPGQYLIAIWTGGNPGDVASVNVIGTASAVMPGKAAS